MRTLPATGRRLLQSISALHTRSVLSGDTLASVRRAPAKAFASGAVVVAVGALLIPGGHASAQTVHPTTPGASAFTAENFVLQKAGVQLGAPVAYESEDTAAVKAVVAAELNYQAPAQQQPQHDEQASRGEQRTELPAAEQPAPAEQAAAPAAPAEQPAPAPAPAPQPEPAPAPAPQPEPAPAPAPQPEPAKPSWSSPAPGATISNPYHKTNAAYAAGYHTGTDFAVSVGTPVLAVGDSTVVSAGWAGAYGNQVVLKLSDGRFAQYAHLSQLGVKAGQHVDAGTQVGKSGNTGNSHGPHLHFEIRTANQYAKVIDPVGYLKGHGANNF